MSREVLLHDGPVLLPQEEEKCPEMVSPQDENAHGARPRLTLPLLSNIHSPLDVRELCLRDLETLASEVRDFLISSLSRTGGHLAPNLGIVETTLALHKVFKIPQDELIFDVGHQAYVHKMLTGRKHLFDSLRTYRGLSGFSHRDESVYDLFTTGHGGTSLSWALGRAIARDLRGGTNYVIGLIGDGALTEGMALEALNHLGHTQSRVIILLNDNEMSIAPNVGGFSRYFNKVRSEPNFRSSKEYFKHLVKEIPQYGDRLYGLMSKVKNSFKYLITPGIVFEELGIRYMGPFDGHNLQELVSVFEEVKQVTKPVIIHLKTTKGKGFSAAEDNSCTGAVWHGGGPFDPISETYIKAEAPPSYSKIFGTQLCALAETDERVCAVTAAMADGTGLIPFQKQFPDRLFDAAMAEQHAVSMAAGMASCGLSPFVAIYSTFLQRGYDQVIHDVCLQQLPVRFCLDRAGLVGADGPTHHGVFDIAYLRNLPNMVAMAPADEDEFIRMLALMRTHSCGPISVRYPKGAGPGGSLPGNDTNLQMGKGHKLLEGKDLCLIAIGSMVEKALRLAEALKKSGVRSTVVNARFIKPLDEDLILAEAQQTSKIVTLEEGSLAGGFGSAILEIINDHQLDAKILRLGIPDEFVTHGGMSELYKELGLDDEGLHRRTLAWLKLDN
jgi:1-deoxy-D-xylulose-5-phosphate synthase